MAIVLVVSFVVLPYVLLDSIFEPDTSVSSKNWGGGRKLTQKMFRKTFSFTRQLFPSLLQLQIFDCWDFPLLFTNFTHRVILHIVRCFCLCWFLCPWYHWLRIVNATQKTRFYFTDQQQNLIIRVLCQHSVTQWK